ncbi:MAG: hypothetical protein RIC36_20425 [Rhodospirillales bacterium]
MVNNSDKPSPSIEDLDNLDRQFESDRLSAVKTFGASFSEQVVSAIAAIGEISQVANARIQADTRIAIASIASHAEVTCIELIATVELASLKIDQLKGSGSETITTGHTATVAELGNEVRMEIEGGCSRSIEEIERQARLAVSKISKNTDEAISKIQRHVAKVKAAVACNASVASEKLKASKVKGRTPESITRDAELARKKISDFATKVTSQLTTMSSQAISNISALSVTSLKEISKIVKAAELRVMKIKATSLTRLMHLLE